jgi:hypothetical protein
MQKMHEISPDLNASELRESLLTAYGVIRQQTKLICDLSSILCPLIKAVTNEDDYDGLSLGEAYARCSDELAEESNSLTNQTLAVIDAEILRIRGE